MKSEENKPIEVIRDGNLSASIWKREGEKGTYYATTFSKSYRDKRGDYQNSYSFFGTDHLKLAELSKQAYEKERELYDRERQSVREHQPRQQNYDRER